MAVRRFAHSSDAGAILVQTAIIILVLVGFGTFVVDYGIMWVSRGQAQNAADAGAIAGAIARAFDDLAITPAADGKAATATLRAAEANQVWNATPTVRVSFDCPQGVAGSCVRADVYRNGEFASASLPTVFGPVLGITSQGVRATATARAGIGNATNCLRPWGVADLWIETAGTTEGEYNRWRKRGSEAEEMDPHDVYTPPSESGPGTGFRLPRDYGAEVTLYGGTSPTVGSASIVPGWFLPLQLPDGEGGYVSGADEYQEAIATCKGNPVRIGEWLPTEEGAMVGPTDMGFEALRLQDPGADWDGTKVTGSCAPECAPFSPRIVPLAVFDMDDFQKRMANGEWAAVCPTGGRCVHVVNILGFFVDRKVGSNITGYLLRYPGEFIVGAPSLGGGAAFLTTIELVR